MSGKVIVENKLKIYKSSAGSGKTFTLVKEYLRIVLKDPTEYRHVLAITFTNKAAEEMKLRVIEALVGLESGTPSDLRKKLEEELPGVPITENAAIVLRSILHDYPSFAISTIDSFFQKLLRSLAREIHLPLKVELKLEEEDAIMDVTDRILKKSEDDPELADWLQKLMYKKLDEDKGWDIQSEISLIAREMLKERGAASDILSREEIHELFGLLSKNKKEFEKSVRDEATIILDGMKRFGLEPERFAYGNTGVVSFIRKVHKGGDPELYELGERAKKAIGSPEGWLKKEDLKDTQLIDLISREFQSHLLRIESLIVNGLRNYISDTQVLKTLYSYGIVTDLTRMFADYRKEHNQILISDTAKMLQEIITGNDTPFIYEKTGNKYKYLLIDEFQDTSEVQWLNLLPLVENSLSSGHMALMVGDAKQSIYRWRGGNLKLLLEGVQRNLAHFKDLIYPDHLATNYRSKREVVEFNNSIFTNVLAVIKRMDGLDDLATLELAYGKDVAQGTAEKNNVGGHVEVRFIENDSKKKGEDADENGPWKTKSLDFTLATIRSLMEKGYRYRDICLLVRTKNEGNDIARFLFDNGITKVISPDSLLISGSPKIRFLINLFRVLVDPDNAVARSQTLHHYLLSGGGGQDGLHQLFAQPDKWRKGPARKPGPGQPPEPVPMEVFKRLMPSELTEKMDTLAKLPVYEISEQLVKIFGLGGKPDAFIQRFQDLVLEFNSRQHASLRSFLQWWDSNDKARNQSVVIPENENAIRIMTIHKSKGLQFPVVIMPFTNWKILPRGGEDIVWLSSHEKPYDKLGRIGIIASKHLSNSAFEHDWRREQSNSVIDNLNLMYVAFTRAEQELYIFAPNPSIDPKKKTESKSISSLLFQTLLEAGLAPGTDGVLKKGVAPDSYTPKSDSVVSVPLTSYPVNRWQDKIRVSSRTRKLADILKERSTEKARYGVLVHELLSSIATIEDVEPALDKIRFDGLIPENEKEELKSLVLEVTSHPEIRRFFETDWEIKRESEILTPQGTTFRPDRTLTKGKDAILVDFKTGVPNPEHDEQLRNYSTLLKSMGYVKVSNFLVYLKEGPKVVEIN